MCRIVIVATLSPVRLHVVVLVRIVRKDEGVETVERPRSPRKDELTHASSAR